MERAGYMNYSVEVAERFEKEFKELDKYTQKIIKAWIEKNLSNTENPRYLAKVYLLIRQAFGNTA